MLMTKINTKKIKMATLAIAAMLVVLVISVAVVSSQQTLAQTLPAVSIVVIPKTLPDTAVDTNTAFLPKTVTVVIGVNNTVRWINQDDITHWISANNFDDPAFRAAAPDPIDVIDKTTGRIPVEHMPNWLLPAQSFEYSFTKPGEYGFHGRPWELGTVIVLPSAVTSSP